MMKFSSQALQDKIRPLLLTLRRFMGVVVVAAFGAMAGYIMLQVSAVDHLEPDASTVTELIRANASPKIDPNSAKKISDLEDQNIQLKTLFQQARDNPFQE